MEDRFFYLIAYVLWRWLMMVQKDEGLQELIKLLHSNIEDVPEYTRSISPRSISKEEGEEEEKLSSRVCGEEMQSEKIPEGSPLNEPTPTPKSEHTLSFQDADSKLPCDVQYIQNVLADLNVSRMDEESGGVSMI